MHSEKKIYLILYINNVKLIESDKQALNEINHQIMKHFQIMNLSQIHHYLGMKIEVDCQSQQRWRWQQTSNCSRVTERALRLQGILN